MPTSNGPSLAVAVMFQIDSGAIKIATDCCGGGTTFPADDHIGIVEEVADHLRTCLPDLLDETFGPEEA